MAILTAEITAIFTEEVSKYLAQGMIFHPTTMSGSQGEIAKVDLTDGKDVYRITLNNTSDHDNDFNNRFWGNITVLTIEKFTGADISGRFNDFNILWTGSGEQVMEMKWYDISGYRKAWTASKDEALEIQNKHYGRSRIRKVNADTEISVNRDAKMVLRDHCRQHKGYKRIKSTDIAGLVKTRYNDGSFVYRVTFTDNKYAPLVIS